MPDRGRSKPSQAADTRSYGDAPPEQISAPRARLHPNRQGVAMTQRTVCIGTKRRATNGCLNCWLLSSYEGARFIELTRYAHSSLSALAQ